MFTGIIEEVGTVRGLDHRDGAATLDIACSAVLDGTRVGDSIAVNGCCLTATEVVAGGFSAHMMGETLARTGLGRLQPGDGVNLERALAADGRLGGHLVQGHVDAVGEVVAVEPRPEWTVMRFSLPGPIAPYIAEKGSIAVDGTSLTVVDVTEVSFSVGLIPHTLDSTVLGTKRPGHVVNLEADVIAKYVLRLLSHAGVRDLNALGAAQQGRTL